MLTGCSFLGNKASAKRKKTFKAYNPMTQKHIEPFFFQATKEEIEEAVSKSLKAFKLYKQTSPDKRAEFLNRLATNLANEKEEIINRAMLETALPEQRLTGETLRTVNQIKMFAQYLVEGYYCNAKIDTAIPDRQPVPKPDIRQMLIPVGPVAVFGASNFPLAFSVAGGDTISALAAGCSVVVKAHPSHPGTSELVAKVIIKTIAQCGLPESIFSMVHGIDNEIGEWLVKNENIKAVAFTGSKSGGKALYDIAVRREEPIPVYAEMGSVNPVIIFPEALKTRGEQIVKGLAQSVTLGVGQFCTNPGVVFVLDSENTVTFFENLKGEFKKIKPETMLSDKIAGMYKEKLEEMKKNASLLVEGEKAKADTETKGTAYVFYSVSENWGANKKLQQEVFGPSTIVVIAKDNEDLMQIVENLEGQLTITFHGTDKELEQNKDLIEVAKEKAGRLIFNGYPTGVEVCHSMHHGGPFPATTDSKFTSVGTESIKRFLKPICYQNFPDKLLPKQLKNNNPLNILRFVNGNYTKDKIIL
jgi:NADP-dependent aldehyde dehydrogenase